MQIISNVYCPHEDSLIEQYQYEITKLTKSIIHHKLYSSINSTERLASFSEYHVFAVWDFMNLMRALQASLSYLTIPWIPPENSFGCHLINSIIAEEESDINEEGKYMSHFQMYLSAMESKNANTLIIKKFLSDIQRKKNVNMLEIHNEFPYLPKPIQDFLFSTFTVLNKDAHHIAGSFAYAREAITGGMFSAIIKAFPRMRTSASKFYYYFDRHIELDTDKHSKQSISLVNNLCKSKRMYATALETAIYSLNSRLRFSNAVFNIITGPDHEKRAS